MCKHRSHDRGGINRRHFLLHTASVLSAGCLLSFPAFSAAKRVDLPPPDPYDTCPVCGMFPAKYPDWIATVLFKDGHADHFDGAKDFFKYLLDTEKYAKGRVKENIVGLGVTDYYETARIDAREAFYVAGSDVLSPMGHDLLPHPTRAEAEEFMKDHRGKKILTFHDVTMAMLLALDRGQFELES